jgi:peptidyl-prolyl cis-trans isomerase SurA
VTPLHTLGAVVLAGLLGDVATVPSSVGSRVLDRLVAVVGERPVLLSELRRRVRPAFYRVDAIGGDVKTRADAKEVALRETLDRIIDGRLVEAAADAAHVTVLSHEIDAGIRAVAAQAKLSVDELLAEAQRQGMSEAEYKDEIRRQLLEGKLLRMRNVQVTDVEGRAVYATWKKEQTGPDASIDLRILVLHVAPDAAPAAKKATETLATKIATQARAGTDFCGLVSKHSQDTATTSSCGSRGPVPRSSLLPELEKAARGLKPGEISGPISFIHSGDQTYCVIQRAPGSAPEMASYESVRDQMMARAFGEASERERKRWLEELHKNTFIEKKL